MTNKALRKHIGKHLQKARKAAGYKSAKAYADHLGISKDTYTGYEQGRIMFTIEQAWDFAQDLDIDIDSLVGHEAPRSFADPAQAALNGYYETMNSVGRDALVETARLMSDGDSVRIEKDSPKLDAIPPQMEGVA